MRFLELLLEPLRPGYLAEQFQERGIILRDLRKDFTELCFRLNGICIIPERVKIGKIL